MLHKSFLKVIRLKKILHPYGYLESKIIFLNHLLITIVILFKKNSSLKNDRH